MSFYISGGPLVLGPLDKLILSFLLHENIDQTEWHQQSLVLLCCMGQGSWMNSLLDLPLHQDHFVSLLPIPSLIGQWQAFPGRESRGAHLTVCDCVGKGHEHLNMRSLSAGDLSSFPCHCAFDELSLELELASCVYAQMVRTLRSVSITTTPSCLHSLNARTNWPGMSLWILKEKCLPPK